MSAARNFSNVAAAATLTSSCSDVDTTVQVSTTSGFPTAPFVLVIDKDRVAEELVLVTAVNGVALTTTRGWGGTTAAPHPAGASVKHVFTGSDAQDSADHIGDGTLHVNATTIDNMRLPAQWARPGFIVPAMVTGTPTSVSAGPTTILSGPTSGRRVLKHLLVSGPPGAVFTITVAGTALYCNQLDSTSNSAAVLAPYALCIPIANGETIQATVTSGPCVFTPVYGDRTDAQLDRRGIIGTSSASATDIVAAGTARTLSQVFISNAGASSGTASVSIGSTSITGVVTVPPRTLITLDDPIAITSAQALRGTADGTHAITFLAVGI